MFKYKKCIIPIFAGVLPFFSVGVSAQEIFKSSDFLRYAKSAQESYITTSAMMAGVIATQNDDQQAACVNKWISKHGQRGFQSVTKVMRDYPDHHPQGIILAVLQKACGSFKYAER